MIAEMTTLDNPIDGMYLIHKALRCEADRTVEQARRLENGSSLQSFKLAFAAWAAAITYHAEKELGTEMSKALDEYCQLSPHGPIERAKWALLEQENGEYLKLRDGALDVMTVLEEDIGATSIISRTKQHLYFQVIELRAAQEDHLESEEAMVLPLIREILSYESQLKIVGGLLIDRDADDQRWMIDWISRDLTVWENLLLLELASRIDQANSRPNRAQLQTAYGEDMAAKNFSNLEHPIDVMPLMHKAFRAKSARTEALAAQASTIEDIAELNEAFGFWVKQILYHATIEDEVMTAPLQNSQPARDNEAEHAVLAGKAGELVNLIASGKTARLEDSAREAAFTLEEKQHKELGERSHEVEEALKEALGEKKVTARTIRHIHSKLLGVRILELDHFENEEAFVCSLVRDEIDEAGQLYMVRRLLIDDTADDPRWIIDWVHSELDPAEQSQLDELENRFRRAVPQPA